MNLSPPSKIAAFLFLNVLFVATQASSAPIISNGLVAYYPLNGDANDGSGNSNHGTLAGGSAFEQGRLGQAVSLDGIDGRVELPVLFAQDQDPISFAAWVLSSSIITSVEAPNLFGEYERGSVRNGFAADADSLHFDQYNPLGGAAEVNADIASRLQGWTHVGIVKELDQVSFYLDGVLIGAAPHTETYAGLPPTVAALGARSLDGSWSANSSAYSFHGLLDEVYLFDRALSGEEIASLSAVPSPSTLILIVSVFGGLMTSRKIFAR